jgi:hypothetical protein
MDCQHSTSSVDFCEDPDCAATTLGPDQLTGLVKPHLPTHEVFKVYTDFHCRDYAMAERQAKKALGRARLLFTEQRLKVERTSKTPEASILSPICSLCQVEISLSQQCWVCAKCREL